MSVPQKNVAALLVQKTHFIVGPCPPVQNIKLALRIVVSYALADQGDPDFLFALGFRKLVQTECDLLAGDV